MTTQPLPRDSAGGPSAAPAVSVLIPVYNGAAYIEAAVRSIMAQTLRDIEIVVVDDGSTDETGEILRRLAGEDGRVRVEALSPNRGLVGALNHGLGVVRSPCVARMDADDVAHPERLVVQKRYMDAHPAVIVIGGSVRRIRADGTVFQTSFRPKDAFMCRWTLRFRLPIIHPTVMFRYPMPDGSRPTYDARFPVTEDIDYFQRMMIHGEMVCLPEVLLDYRHHANNVTKNKWEQLNLDAERLFRKFASEELPADVMEALSPAYRAHFRFSSESPRDVLDGFRRMLRHDLERAPDYAAWLQRQTAQLAYDTLTRSGRSKRNVGLAFLRHGRDFLPSLMLRFAEIGRMLPRSMMTYADVWAERP